MCKILRLHRKRKARNDYRKRLLTGIFQIKEGYQIIANSVGYILQICGILKKSQIMWYLGYLAKLRCATVAENNGQKKLAAPKKEITMPSCQCSAAESTGKSFLHLYRCRWETKSMPRAE
jgi:hypothetical protein